MAMLMCPNCNVATQAIDRFGVELDMCPGCRGVWLDRGELEKVLELAGPRRAEGRDARHDHRDHGWRDRKRPSLFDLFD